MDWQWALVLACVVMAAAYVVRAAYRLWRPRAGSCGGSCGCGATAEADKVTIVPPERLTLRRRA